MVTVDEMGANGQDRGQRLADRGDILEFLPSTAEGFVDGDVFLDDPLLCDGVLILKFVELALGVEHVEEIDKAAFISATGEGDGTLAGVKCFSQVRQAILLGRVVAGCVVNFFDRSKDNAFVVEEIFARTEIFKLNHAVDAAKIEDGENGGGAC